MGETTHTPGLTAEFWAIVGAAIGISGLLIYLLTGLSSDVKDLHDDVRTLSEKTARIETLMEIYVRGEPIGRAGPRY